MLYHRIFNTTYSGQVLTLRDSDDRYHVARATCDVPQFGLELLGHPPSLGFHILVGARHGQVFRLIFEQIDCESPKRLDLGLENTGQLLGVDPRADFTCANDQQDLLLPEPSASNMQLSDQLAEPVRAPAMEPRAV